MDERVLNIAEDMYFHYTNKNIESSELLPYYTSDDLTMVKKFYINKTFYEVGYVNQETGIEDKRIAILTDCIIFSPQLRSDVTNKRIGKIVEGISVMNLVENRIIQPFLLFINGRFVKWSEISIYKDNRYQVMVVDSIVEYITDEANVDLQVLQIPLPMLSYTEKWDIKEDETLVFAFNDNGYMDINGHTRIYMRNQDIIGYIQLQLPGGTVEEDDIQVPDECQLYPSNIIVFKENLIYPNPKIVISPYNTMTINDGITLYLEYKMFYDKRVNTPYNNVSQITNHNYLKNTYLNTDPNPDWLKSLHELFDFDFDITKSYDENLENFSKYMIDYNYREIIDRIRSKNVYICSGYVGDYTNKNLLLTYPKEFTHAGTGYMLFINGILSNSVTKEFSYGISVDLSKYSDNSIFEFVAFQSYIDDSETISIDSSNPDKKYFNGFWEHGSNYDLFSRRHPDEVFHLSEKMSLESFDAWYKIDPSQYTVTDDGTVFGDFYSSIDSLNIIRVPRTKFAYNRFIIEKTEDFNVHLNDTFCLCEDPSKYMVFVNGYRIESSLYRVITPLPNLPFTDQAIYFNIILKKGDMVEVFYTPMSIVDEVHIENLDHSTESGTGVDQLGFITGPDNYPVPMSRDLQFFFVSGIKIPKDYLMDISYNMTRLVVNIKSIENLCVIGYDNELIDFIQLLKLKDSKLDKVYQAHDKQGIGILTDTYTAVTNITPIRQKDITDHALINEIVRYYYGPVNKGIPFRYDYDSSVYAEVDANGNIVIDVMDATKRINLSLKE